MGGDFLFQVLASAPVATPYDTTALSTEHVHYPRMRFCGRSIRHAEKIYYLLCSTYYERHAYLTTINHDVSWARGQTGNGDQLYVRADKMQSAPLGLGGGGGFLSQQLRTLSPPFSIMLAQY